eukprot:SAG31_NODE_2811_length_5052_cov_3.554613_3_plen_433_part_00
MLQEQRAQQGLDCACCCYKNVCDTAELSGNTGAHSLNLGFCLCKEQAERVRQGPEASAAINGLFEQIDTDRSGYLDRDEISCLAKKLSLTLTASELDAAMRSMDKDGSGQVDLDEFTAWYRGDDAGALLAAALTCTHCKTYGIGFACGGWTSSGYSAWNLEAQHASRAQLLSRCSPIGASIDLPSSLPDPPSPQEELPKATPLFRRKSTREVSRRSPTRFFDADGRWSALARAQTPSAKCTAPPPSPARRSIQANLAAATAIAATAAATSNLTSDGDGRLFCADARGVFGGHGPVASIDCKQTSERGHSGRSSLRFSLNGTSKAMHEMERMQRQQKRAGLEDSKSTTKLSEDISNPSSTISLSLNSSKLPDKTAPATTHKLVRRRRLPTRLTHSGIHWDTRSQLYRSPSPLGMERNEPRQQWYMHSVSLNQL